MKRKIIMTIALVIILLSFMFIACLGIIIKDKNNEKKQIIPEFKMGMEFTNSRRITAKISDSIMSRRIFDSEGNEVTEQEEGVEYTEENGYRIEEELVNPNYIRTLDNYRKSVDVIREKLDKMGAEQYEISLNEETGELVIDIPEDAQTETIMSVLQSQATLLFLDTSTFETVFDNTYVKSADVVTRQGDLEVGVFLQINLTDEGKTKLKELSQTYTGEVETEGEEGEEGEETTTKEVLVILNGMFLGTTAVPNIVYNDSVMVPFALSSNTEELNEGIKEAQMQAIIMNAGLTPITYTYSDETVQTNMELNTVLWAIGIIGAVAIILFVFLIIKYKAKGLVSVYLQLGFLAILLLVTRLTSITLTTEGIAGIVIAFIVNYIFNYILLKNIKENGQYKDANLSFLFTTLPIYIISIIFTFSTIANTASFGMTIFWGIIITYIYNFIFSRYIFVYLTGGNNESN